MEEIFAWFALAFFGFLSYRFIAAYFCCSRYDSLPICKGNLRLTTMRIGRVMSNFLQTVLVSILLLASTASNAVDMAKPTGTGELTITSISIGSEGTTIDFEGPVENYGTVFATHYLQSVDGDRTRGTITGQARAMLNDGGMVITPHHGTFTRSGSTIQIYFTDATNTGVVNFVVWDADVLTKKVDLKYWEVKSAN
jgi:hypothetical protein